MNQELLKAIILEQNNDFFNKTDYVVREEYKKILEYEKLPHMIVISGLRRVGKSTFLEQINKSLSKNRLAYLNFEDEKLLGFKITDFDLLYETLLQLNKEKVFFFDEIQNLDSWEIPLRKLYEKKIKFYITGSNASLLSKELGTKLTGRHLNITLFPFSFKEFISFKKKSFDKDDYLITEKRAVIKSLFNEYFEKGGLPEYLEYNNKELVKQVYEDILYKDILVRYGLTDEKTLRELSKYLLSNIGKEFSFNKLKKLLSLGSSNTVKKYISYLENSYLLFTLEKYDSSLKKQIISNKKIYSIDSAFINITSFSFSKNLGRMLENLVFIELKRRNKEIYYYKQKKECDFIIRKGLIITEAIQVCYELTLENEDREIQGLLEAMKEHKLKQGLLLTYDQEKTIKAQNKTIKVKPAWKWLLEN